MILLTFVAITYLTAVVASWMLILAYKWGIISFLQVHAKTELLEKLLSCDFCLSWWTCVGLSVCISLFLGNAIYLLVPFFSTTFTRSML